MRIFKGTITTDRNVLDFFYCRVSMIVRGIQNHRRDDGLLQLLEKDPKKKILKKKNRRKKIQVVEKYSKVTN